MGLGGISIWQLVIILVIVLLLFGTKRLKGLGGDLGTAIKGFKKAIKEDDSQDKADHEKVTADATEQQTEAAEKEKASASKSDV